MTTRQVLLIVAGVVAALTLVVVFVFPDWFWHPLGFCSGTAVQVRDCKGYNSWSGSFSDIGEITLVGGMLTLILGFWNSHNCHQKGCLRLNFHEHPAHGHPVCKKHYSEHPHGNIPGT